MRLDEFEIDADSDIIIVGDFNVLFFFFFYLFPQQVLTYIAVVHIVK